MTDPDKRNIKDERYHHDAASRYAQSTVGQPHQPVLLEQRLAARDHHQPGIDGFHRMPHLRLGHPPGLGPQVVPGPVPRVRRRTRHRTAGSATAARTQPGGPPTGPRPGTSARRSLPPAGGHPRVPATWPALRRNPDAAAGQPLRLIPARPGNWRASIPPT